MNLSKKGGIKMKASPIAYERAELARDMEYTKCMIEDEPVNQALISVSSKMDDTFNPDEIPEEEIDAAIEEIPVDDTQRTEEIERIVQSNENLDIDAIMGYGNLYNKLEERDDEE